MKAIISPYEPATRHNETVSIPAVVIDTGATEFDSSDVPESIVVQADGERLVFLQADHHAQAVTLGYVEVDV